MGKSEQDQYLREHLRYELSMLESCHRKLLETKSQEDWNVLYESLVVHLRNVTNFLTNSDKGNMMAKDFNDAFKAPKPQKLIGSFQRLNNQVLHMSKGRPTSDDEKLGVGSLTEMVEWATSAFSQFVNCLSDDDKKIWEAGQAQGLTIKISTKPSATNHIRTTSIK